MKDPILRGPKVYTEGNQRYRLTAHGGLHYIRGNRDAYFTLTADQYRAEHGVWRGDCGGCCHDLILKHWPELAPLAALHLSDTKGAPMHAASNAWYWMAGALCVDEQYHGGTGSGAKTPLECLGVFADHVRISLHEAHLLRDVLAAKGRAVSHYKRVWEKQDIPVMKGVLSLWIDQQAERWQAEATACIEALGLKEYGDTRPLTVKEGA